MGQNKTVNEEQINLTLKNKQYIYLGKVGRPHGVQGAFFFKTTDLRTKLETNYKELLLETNDGFVATKVLESYPSGNMLVIKLDYITSRSMLEGFYQKKIYLPKEQIILNEGEYLVNDLVGMKVITKEKGEIGEIISVINFGAQDNFEIKLTGSKTTVYYPFIEKFVFNVNPELKTVEVEYISEFFEGN